MRGKHSVMLGKRDLLLCCCAWGYSSDIWSFHGRGSRAAAAAGRIKSTVIPALQPVPYVQTYSHPAVPGEEEEEEVAPETEEVPPLPSAAAAAAAAASPPTLLERRLDGGGFAFPGTAHISQLTAESAWAAAQLQLTPLIQTATALFAGREACSLFSQPGAPSPPPIYVESLKFGTALLSQREAFMRRMADLTREAQAAQEEGGGGGGSGGGLEDEPAWRVLAGADTHTEGALRCFAYGTLNYAKELSATSAAPAPPLHAAEKEAAASLLGGYVAASELGLRMMALYADAKLARFSVFLSIERTVQCVMHSFILSALQAYKEREEWVQACMLTHQLQAQLQVQGSAGWADKFALATDQAHSIVSGHHSEARVHPALFPTPAADA